MSSPLIISPVICSGIRYRSSYTAFFFAGSDMVFLYQSLSGVRQVRKSGNMANYTVDLFSHSPHFSGNLGDQKSLRK